MQDRRSISGYCFKVYGSLISWRSQKQPTVSLSSTEAEFIALANAASEALWLRGIMEELGIHVKQLTVHEDNQACITITQQPRQHQRMKHIDVKYSFLIEVINNGAISLSYIPSQDQVADNFTKPLTSQNFSKHTLSLGICYH